MAAAPFRRRTAALPGVRPPAFVEVRLACFGAGRGAGRANTGASGLRHRAAAHVSGITLAGFGRRGIFLLARCRSEEHTSELQSLMRIAYAVFCLKKKKQHKNNQ